MLYRAFPMLPHTGAHEPGGALHVPRLYQGAGRHDNPRHYGALYASGSPRGAVAEWVRRWRGASLQKQDLRRPSGARMALAALDDGAASALVDLDDPANLVARDLRPSAVATRDRRRTRPLALALYGEGVDGFEWWSTVEASWTNVTLFAERVADRLAVAGEPEPLTLDHPALREAADAVGVRLGA